MPQPAHVVLGGLRPLLGLLQLLLGLAELGQVERRDLLGVLDLLLVPEMQLGNFYISVVFGEAAFGSQGKWKAHILQRGSKPVSYK